MGSGVMYRDAYFVPDLDYDAMLSPQDQMEAAFKDLEGYGGAWNGRLWI